MKWVSIIFVLILCSSFLQAFGQEAIPNKILVEPDGGKLYYGQFTPYGLQVIDKGRYNVIKFSVNVTVSNLPFDVDLMFDGNPTILKDENSTTYHVDLGECQTPYISIINGKQSDNTSYNVCYSVDKSLKKFSIWYQERQLAIGGGNTVQIGNIDLTQNVNGQIQTQPSNSSYASTSTSNTNQSVTNIFEQLMNLLKQIFHFVILGPSFLHDF